MSTKEAVLPPSTRLDMQMHNNKCMQTPTKHLYPTADQLAKCHLLQQHNKPAAHMHAETTTKACMDKDDPRRASKARPMKYRGRWLRQANDLAHKQPE